MNVSESLEAFAKIYIGDSMMQVVELRTADAICRLTFHAGSVLPHAGASIFEPVARYTPAIMTIGDVWEVSFEGRYQLNATVVDFDAVPTPDGERIEYTFTLTGGSDPDAFMVKMKVVGGGFSFEEG